MLELKNLYDKWCKIDDKIRFLFIGCVNAGLSYLLFVLFILILGEPLRQLCVILQWSISSVFSYFNQKTFVFCTKGNYWKEYIKCCSTWFISYLINTVLLEVLLKVMRNIFISQLISLFLVSVITYILFKYFAFKRKSIPKQEEI